MENEMKKVPYDEYMAEGKELFGEDIKHWKFICPNCKTSQTAQDFLNHGVKKDIIEGQLAFSCIGRSVDKIGCNWTLGGLFRIHTLEVERDGKSFPRFEYDYECPEIAETVVKEMENKKNSIVKDAVQVGQSNG